MRYCFIPARSGSERIVNKNMVKLGGFSLLEITVRLALRSTLFDRVFVTTDSSEYEKLAISFGAESLCLRPSLISQSSSCDIEWVKYNHNYMISNGIEIPESITILRPTSPFRSLSFIESGLALFEVNKNKIDSVRSVAKCKEHPAKMWVRAAGCDQLMYPLLPFGDELPWHSKPYRTLPEILIQTASLEVFNVQSVLSVSSLAGVIVKPLITNESDGFDINLDEDLGFAEYLVAQNHPLISNSFLMQELIT